MFIDLNILSLKIIILNYNHELLIFTYCRELIIFKKITFLKKKEKNNSCI